jgi:hypothetical protein
MTDLQTILDRSLSSRVNFDPADSDHLAEVKFFMTEGKWRGSCPFYLEHPFLEIPAMIKHRFLEHTLA